MDRVSEQSLSRAGLAEKHDWYFRFCRERGELQTTRHGIIARGQVFDSQPGKRLLHGQLLFHTLTQLPNRLERIFNQRTSADDDVRFSSHSNAQRQNLSRS